MREERVHAGQCVGGLDLVGFVVQLAVFLRYGQETIAGHLLKRVGRFRMDHSDPHIGVVGNERQCQCGKKSGETSPAISED